MQPQCQAFDEATARTESLVVVVLEISQQLQGWKDLRHRFQVLPFHDLCEQPGGDLVTHLHCSRRGQGCPPNACCEPWWTYQDPLAAKRRRSRTTSNPSQALPGIARSLGMGRWCGEPGWEHRGLSGARRCG